MGTIKFNQFQGMSDTNTTPQINLYRFSLLVLHNNIIINNSNLFSAFPNTQRRLIVIYVYCLQTFTFAQSILNEKNCFKA